MSLLGIRSNIETSMLVSVISLFSLLSTTTATSQNVMVDSDQTLKSVSAATNTSNIIILGGGVSGTTGTSGWTGSSVTLSQCNERCASVNLILFTTCGSYANVFRDQMRCSCSTTFISEVEICSSCCNELSYQSQFQELTQVSTACQALAVNGNTTDGARSISYSTETQYQTLTNFATVSYGYTTTLVVAGPTVYTATTTTTDTTTSHTSTSTSTTPGPSATSYITTSAPVATTSTSTQRIPATNPIPTVALPTVTATSAAMDFSTSMQAMVGPLLFTSFLLIATALF